MKSRGAGDVENMWRMSVEEESYEIRATRVAEPAEETVSYSDPR